MKNRSKNKSVALIASVPFFFLSCEMAAIFLLLLLMAVNERFTGQEAASKVATWTLKS